MYQRWVRWFELKERKFIVNKGKWDRVDDFDPGPLVFRNDQALESSREHRKRPGRIIAAIESISIVLFILLTFQFIDDPQLSLLFFIFMVSSVAVVESKSMEFKNLGKVNIVPSVYERSIVYNQVSYFSHDIVMIPYDQLEDIRHVGTHVILKPKKSRLKWGFRFEEVGDRGFQTLMDLFRKAQSKSGS